MAYAQTSYPQTQGINGKYSVHDIGCFLTGFCNLLSDRFGHAVDPLTLNAYFVNHGCYIDVDDGVRDDLSWTTITAYDSNVIATKTVNHGKEQTAGLPSTRNAIVKFYYKSPRTGKFGTHFSLYDGDGYIIDSWDGKRKAISSTSYGQPVAYAEYGRPAPQAVIVEQHNGANEMITSADEATKIYKLLRPNSNPSQDEINTTAGKRSYVQFINDAQHEVAQRDANLRNLSDGVNALQNKIAEQQATISELNSTVSVLTQQVLDAQTAAKRAAETQAAIAQSQPVIADIQPAIVTEAGVVNAPMYAPAPAEPKAKKPTLLTRLIVAFLKRKKA